MTVDTLTKQDQAAADVALLEAAAEQFDAAYAASFPAGGDAADHDEAKRCGVEAVVALVQNGRAARGH